MLLLEWITEADFTKEVSLVSLGDHPFKLDEQEEKEEITNERLIKIIKM